MSSSTAAMAVGGSTSTVSAEAASGWHVFKVQGYSQYKGSAAGVGRTVTSSAFGVGGHTWRIEYMPCCRCDGYRNSEWICFGLQHDSGAADGGGDVVKAHFTLSLLGEDGEPLPSYTRISRHHQLEFSRSTSYSYGCHFGCFIRSRTFDSLYLKEDCFSVRCSITLLLETRNESVQPLPDLPRLLGSLLLSRVGGDVTFEVGKETFVAHKSVLAARSPVFKAEFFGGMMEHKEATAARVRIFGIHARAFKAMLHFIYTDSLSLPEIDDDDKIVMAQHLLVAADRYDIQRLKLICENKLCTFVNASLVATTLVLAEKHGCRRLKEACFKVLKCSDNFRALGNKDYDYMTRSCPTLLGEFLAEHIGL